MGPTGLSGNMKKQILTIGMALAVTASFMVSRAAYNPVGDPAVLPIGSDGTVLTASSSRPSGVIWGTVSGQAEGLLAENNLSDVASNTAARANLGLGTAALRPLTDFLSSSTPYIS